MAVTGLILIGFVLGHMLGNLTVFAGAEKINEYAKFLKGNLPLLWGTRVVVVGSLILHVWAAVSLTGRAKAARPVAYGKKVPQASTFASRTMRVGGLLLLAFIVFHLLHFTAGVIQPAPFSETDVHANLVQNFSIPWVALIYLVAMLALGAHLFHGVWASFRTLGLVKPSGDPFKRRLAVAVAGIVWLGFTLIPSAILAGLVK